MVDWRRSARGDRFYVREREREAAQTAWFWIDPSRGFDWSADPKRTTKLRRARTIALALAILLARGGERVGALGSPPRIGASAADRLAFDFLNGPLPLERALSRIGAGSTIIFLSDFYEPIETWRSRVSAAGSEGATGALAMIADPAEEDFPYQGRTLFKEPGSQREVLIGRAEQARGEYAERLEAHRRAIHELGARFSFPSLLHRTDHSAAPALSMLIALVSERFA